MKKILNSIEHLFIKSLWAVGLASVIFATSFILTPSSYAATPVKQAAPDVIQPFELTNPAATRSEAYDEIAKLNKDPKALIAAEAKEEQAEEKAYEQEQKAIGNAGK
ncbi:MAG: hypothetical protein LH613_03775 [Chamaesiphon sp.]|nr:hypothetical protein [Chamaesiphon sp.]